MVPDVAASPVVTASPSARRVRMPVRLAAALVTVLSVAAAIRLSWVSDDALITLRTALNTAHGWGWGFNATEAVQGYTHPLWFLIWLAMGSLLGNWLVSIVVFSIGCTGIAVWLIFSRGYSVTRVVLVGGMLLLSTAFIEYSTSGLETPLGYLLFAAGIALTSGSVARSYTTLAPLGLGVIAGALFLTRMDFSILLAPFAVLWIWQHRREPRQIALGAAACLIPVTAWFAWAWTTYGYLLPATYEAKTNVADSRTELVGAGLTYMKVSLTSDLATATLLLTGIVLGLLWGNAQMRAWILGVVAYIGYIVWIGGDFMVGRFLAVPTFITAAVLVKLPFDRPNRAWIPTLSPVWRQGIASTAIVVLAAAGYAFGRPASALADPQQPRWSFQEVSVTDEHAMWGGALRGNIVRYLQNRLSKRQIPLDRFDRPSFKWAAASLWQIEQLANNWPNAPALVRSPAQVQEACGGLGVIGMASGPTFHWIDRCALVDRFLASLPGKKAPVVGQAGHYVRQVPKGYVEAIRSGDPTLVADKTMSKRLARIWERIRQPYAGFKQPAPDRTPP